MSTKGLPGIGEIELYKSRLQQATANVEAELRTWKRYDDEYATVQGLLQELPKVVRKQIMVPLGDLAFMPGAIVHTNEVTVLLGENWFVECSADHAAGIVVRRREYTKQKLVEMENKLEGLRTRSKLLSNDFVVEAQSVDADGDQVNEEGLKFVDIVEPYNEEEEKKRKKAPTTVPKTNSTPHPKTKAKELDDFDRKFFARMEELEREEEWERLHGKGDETSDDDDEYEDVEADSEDEMRFEHMDDDDDDFNEAPTSRPTKPRSNAAPKKAKNKGKRVTFSADVQKGELVGQRSPSARDPQPGPADPHQPAQKAERGVESNNGAATVKDVVEEHDVVEFEDESDVEDYLFGKELAEEYYKKRHQFLAAHSGQSASAVNDEEEREALKEQKISRFRAARMAVRDAVEFPDEVVRAAVEPPVEPEPSEQPPRPMSSRFKPRVPVGRRERRHDDN
ncbi:uri1, prefoldin-like chaperone, partial [Rhizophlyctis rosea]